MRRRRSDSGSIMYSFEELQPYPEYCLFVHGEAEIDWYYDGGDAFSGYQDGFSYSIKAILIDHETTKGSKLNLDGANPLWDLIEERLIKDYEDHILTKIGEEYNAPDYLED